MRRFGIRGFGVHYKLVHRQILQNYEILSFFLAERKFPILPVSFNFRLTHTRELDAPVRTDTENIHLREPRIFEKAYQTELLNRYRVMISVITLELWFMLVALPSLIISILQSKSKIILYIRHKIPISMVTDDIYVYPNYVFGFSDVPYVRVGKIPVYIIKN